MGKRRNILCKHKRKILFICKKNKVYNESIGEVISNTGLKTSVEFIVNMLNENHIIAHIVEVNDNNDIDREVTKFKPNDVIIEALWVVPEKFNVLKRLHPKVNWIVRLHSELPFLAQEGIAVDWIRKYLSNDITIACNSLNILQSFEEVFNKKILYLPNFFKVDMNNKKKSKDISYGIVNIGCFGAIRTLKNQLIQAFSAFQFANRYGLILHFHINSTRVSRADKTILRNIRALFNDTQHTLVEHSWLNRHDFVELISKMNIGMQISFSETFNFVAADFVNQNIPIVTSDQIKFINPKFQAIATNNESIIDKLRYAYKKRHSCSLRKNKKLLLRMSKNAEKIWVVTFNK